MGGIAHIISPMSAAWSGWTLLALFLCAVLSEFMQPGIIMQAPASLFASTDRTYKEAPANTFGQILIAIFRIGTLSMGICMSLYTGGVFSFGAFAAVCGIIIAFMLLKKLCLQLLDYTFMLSQRFMSMNEPYGYIATVATCILYPCLLIVMRIGKMNWCPWILGAVALIFLILCTYRMARTYIQKPVAILYVIIYLATMEIVPLGLLYYISSKTILYL